uniref:G-protein coupled receptors family 1 profile domain-containing protein n=1 Tax=Anopheles farauti TaxID=69004 RepID=A0A182Q7K7_9DIPT
MGEPTSCGSYLVVLLSDTCYLIGQFLVELTNYIQDIGTKFRHILQHALLCFLSVWFVVAFTVERFIAVLHIRSNDKPRYTVRWAKIVTLALTIGGIFISLAIFCLRLTTILHYRERYHLRYHRARVQSGSRVANSQIKISKMLLIVPTVFVCLILPSYIVRVKIYLEAYSVVIMSTVSLNGFVGARTGGGGGGKLPPCAELLNDATELACVPAWTAPGTPSPVMLPVPVLAAPVPITAGIVVIVVTVEELELVLAFMLISMLDSADETCNKFSIKI